MKLPKFHRLTKRVVAVAAAGGLVLGAAGIAAAYLTASGTGTGTGAIASAAGTLSVSQSGTPAALAPGGSTTVTFKVTNPNTYTVKFTGASASFTSPATTTACGLAIGTLSATTGTLAKHATAGHTATITVPVTMTTEASTQSGCGFTVKLTV